MLRNIFHTCRRGSDSEFRKVNVERVLKKPAGSAKTTFITDYQKI